MGNALFNKSNQSQVLVCGPEGSGKTTLIYRKILRQVEDFSANPTIGFQYEEIKNSQENYTVGFWDVGGGDACRMTTHGLLQNVRYNALLFVIDISEDIKSIYGGVNLKDLVGVQNRSISDLTGIDLAKKQIHYLMACDELRHIHTLAICLNCKQSSPLYNQIFSKDKRTSLYIKKLSEKGVYNNKEPDDLPDELEGDATH